MYVNLCVSDRRILSSSMGSLNSNDCTDQLSLQDLGFVRIIEPLLPSCSTRDNYARNACFIARGNIQC